MTREEHIENLKAIASDMPSDKCADWIESLMAGVKSLEQEPCEDVVSRQAVEDTIINYRWKYSALYESIKQLPSVTPQPKFGYISIDDAMSAFDDFMCNDIEPEGQEVFLELLKDRAERAKNDLDRNRM